MRVFSMNKNGFTLVEIFFVAVISVIVIGAILFAYMFTATTWTGERERTYLRVDLMKALETIKSDLRLSDLNKISYYPSGGEPYTAISMPVAETDADGFFTLNASDEIDWDKTVIYHVHTNAGTQTLRRTVYDPRDNTMTDDQRYTQLENVVTSGEGSGANYTTDTTFLENLETFEISSLSTIIDFYTDSTTAVKSDKVVFGWASFDEGDHTIRFEVTGKNDSSGGYDLGVDCILIEPAGSVRELEYYNSAGILTKSGGTASRVYDPVWSNNNYAEFDASGAGDYIEFTDHYDLWRESAFENVVLDNAITSGEEVRIAIDIPGEDEEGEIVWLASQATGDSQSEGHDGSFPWGASGQGVTVRTSVSAGDISKEGDLIRVKFQTYEGAPLLVESAYITRKDDTSGNAYDGYANLDPSGRTIEEYHRHQQLFFRDTYDYDSDSDTGEVTSRAWIPAGSSDEIEMWSMWTAFPLVNSISGSDVDYLVTFYLSDPSYIGCTYWEGSSTFSYYLTGDSYTQAQLEQAAGTPDWGTAGFTPDGTSQRVYAVESIDRASTSGSVVSQVFDTTLTTPDYDTITASEYTTSGSTITLKGRSSTSEYMTGATDWSSISASSIDGNDRYVQFQAELETVPVWEESSTLSYADYITSQLGDGLDYTFPSSGGTPYITDVTSPEIDDVTIDWQPDAERVCAITGYIARKNDYGQAKLTVDGADIIKVLSLHVKVSKDIQGRTIEEENYVDVQPRNTGK